MRLQMLLFLSHGFCLALGVTSIGVAYRTPEAVLIAAAVAVAIAAIVSWVLASRMSKDLIGVTQLIATGRRNQRRRSAIRELNELADEACEYAQRWREAVMNARQESQAIAEIISRFEPESSLLESGNLTSRIQLLLSDLGRSVEGDLERLAGCVEEIDRHARQIGADTEEQSDSVNKATTYIEQASLKLDAASQRAEATRGTVTAAEGCVEEGLTLIRTIGAGLDRIRNSMDTREKRLRALGNRAEEIGTIVETIGAISDRTDMLALNASIESLRAGENGRGFALVAEEVRKLAEQVAQSTQEVSQLIDSVQRETHDAISTMADERSHVDAELRRVDGAAESLQRIRQFSDECGASVGGIVETTRQQLKLMQDIVTAMERVYSTTKSTRSRAEGVTWSVSTLNTLTQQLESVVEPLRNGRSHGRTARTDHLGRTALPATVPSHVERPTGEPAEDVSAGETTPATAIQ